MLKRQHLVPQPGTGGSYLVLVKGTPSPALGTAELSWLLPLCHGRQGTTAAPMPAELQTFVSYFKEHFKRGSIATKSALISSLRARAGTSELVPVAQRVPKEPGASRGAAGASWQGVALEEPP